MSLSTSVGSIGQGIAYNNVQNQWQSQPMPETYPINNKMHTFTCEQVENGWTLTYRGKSYIAADIDSLMDQMKVAMVAEKLK